MPLQSEAIVAQAAAASRDVMMYMPHEGLGRVVALEKNKRGRQASAREGQLAAIAHTLRSDLRLDLAHLPIRLAFEGGTLAVDGAVPTLAHKRRALQRAAAHPSVTWVVDRLRVTPSTLMNDAEIRDHVIGALLEEGAFAECAIRQRVACLLQTVQAPLRGRGDLCVSVDDGVVTLTGKLPTRAHKCLAGVLAWWVPGTRDVIDGVRAPFSRQDDDDEVTDAVRTALEKDPFVDASQIQVETKNNVVRLQGLVWSAAERETAENDAWYVFRVSDVVNNLRVAKLA